MFSSVGNQWRIAIGLAAITVLAACNSDKPVNPGTKESSAGRVIVTSDGSFAPNGRKYGVTVVSAPRLVSQLDNYSFTDSPPSLDAGDEYLMVSVRLTTADGDGSEPVPFNAAGLADIPFRIAIPNSAYESLTYKQWTNEWAICMSGVRCWGDLSVASTDPASQDLDFMGDNRPQIGDGVTMVMYAIVPQGFETVLDQAQLFWFGVTGSGTQTEIPLPKS